VQRRAVAQEADAHLLDQIEVTAPLLVVAAALHLVDTQRAALDLGNRILDPRGKHKGRNGLALRVGFPRREINRAQEGSRRSVETLRTFNV